MYFCCVKTVAELFFGYINLSVVYFEYFITIFYIHLRDIVYEGLYFKAFVYVWKVTSTFCDVFVVCLFDRAMFVDFDWDSAGHVTVMVRAHVWWVYKA